MKIERIKNFPDLVLAVGQLHSRIQHGNIVFRGQTRVHPVQDRPHSLRPSFFRDPKADSRALNQLLRRVQNHLPPREEEHVWRAVGAEMLLQHYERYPTRMLDCTSSLHVAASFALDKDWVREPAPAVVYVLDVDDSSRRPGPNQLGLAMVAPALVMGATRPQRQAASMLYRRTGEHCDSLDFADRVIAAYEIHSEDSGRFWRGFMSYDVTWMLEKDGVDEWLSKHLSERAGQV